MKEAVLDGEIICLDQNGVSQFNAMLERSKEPVFYAFDLLWFNSTDLKDLPLIARKKVGPPCKAHRISAQNLRSTGLRRILCRTLCCTRPCWPL